MTTVTARWLAGGLLLLTVAALAVSAWFGVANGGLMNAFAFTPLLLAFAAVGAIVAGHRPANPIGWLFQAEGLGFAVGVATDTFARHAIRTGAAPSSVAWADWLGVAAGRCSDPKQKSAGGLALLGGLSALTEIIPRRFGQGAHVRI